MVDLLGFAGGAFLMLSFLPQIVKSLRTKSMRDLSWGMLGATLFSGLFYEAYAVALQLTPVIIMNGIFVTSVAASMVLKFRFDSSTEVPRG